MPPTVIGVVLKRGRRKPTPDLFGNHRQQHDKPDKREKEIKREAHDQRQWRDQNPGNTEILDVLCSWEGPILPFNCHYLPFAFLPVQAAFCLAPTFA